MFDKLILKRNYIVITATLLLFIICYEFAFKKTLTAWQLNKHLKEQVNNNISSLQPSYLEQQQQALSKIIKTLKTDTASFRNRVTTIVAEIGEREYVNVTEVPLRAVASSNKLFIQEITLTGTFPDVLKTLFAIEKADGIGYVRSVNIKNKVPNTNNPNEKVVIEIFLEVVKIF